MTSGNAPLSKAFLDSDNVLAQSVKTVVNLIMLPAVINLDFADVRSVLSNSGVAMIGFGTGTGPNRAKEAATNAINSPLLEASISGARRAIVAVTCGINVSLFDAQDTVNLLIDASGHDVDVKFGVSINDQLDDEILVSVIASDFKDEINFEATGFTTQPTRETVQQQEKETPEEPDENINIEEEGILPGFLNS